MSPDGQRFLSSSTKKARRARASVVSEWADVHNRGRDYRPYNPGMTDLMFLVDEGVEGGFTARAIRVPVFTEADTLDQIKDARSCSTSLAQAEGRITEVP